MIRISDSEVQKFETEHINKVRSMAAECTVLLKKDGQFPLTDIGEIAVYGNGARRTVKGGTGSGDVNVRHFINIEEGLKNAGFKVTTDAWLDAYDAVYEQAKKAYFEDLREMSKEMGASTIMLVMGKVMLEPEYELPLEGKGNVAIYVLSRNSGEGSDRNPVKGDIQLTDTEKRDILALNSMYERFMLVLNVGGMVDLNPVKDIKNILILGQLGTPTGDVLADILVGRNYPSGKLTMTWTDILDYPSTEGFADPDDTYYKEGIYVGYRYFDTVGKEVLYPFGYGLGYTEFDISAREVEANEKEVIVTALVTNTGKTVGKEVVQVYYSAPSGKLDYPKQELAGFVKTKELQPQESCEVTVKFKTTDMAAYEEESASYILEKGNYIIRVGNCSRDTHICGIISIDETVATRKLKHICIGDKVQEVKPTYAPFTYEDEEYEKKYARVISLNSANIITEEATYAEELQEYTCTDTINWDEVKDGTKTIQEFVAILSNEDLVHICLGAYPETATLDSVVGAAAQHVAGAAGETTTHLSEKYHLESLVMADGPAGVRISPSYKIVNGEVKSCASPFNEEILNLMDVEELAHFQMEEPSEEEKAAPEYYQRCVAIPIGTDLAQTFNLDMVKSIGDMIGTELEMFGIQLWLAPALNIHRSPLCGRNFEYYSEDPLVSGLVAAAITKGVQKHRGCGTTIKHFACNNQETNRYTSNSVVGERALREIYLRGFEICVKEAQPHALMTSYNLINGEHACSSKDLNTDVLRNEWGYRGLVMTDWFVTTTLMKSKNTKYMEASTAGCVKAGNEITMPGGASDFKDIMSALIDEQHPYHLTRAELQLCAIRVLEKILELR
jgi:beta-glucosidase